MESYPLKVAGYSNVLFPERAIGQPDDLGAMMLNKGYIILEIDRVISKSFEVNIWASISGIETGFNTFVSRDSKKWALAGRCRVENAQYSQRDLIGKFGDVKYLKIVCTCSGKGNLLFIDAARVKGGDVSNNPMQSSAG